MSAPTRNHTPLGAIQAGKVGVWPNEVPVRNQHGNLLRVVSPSEGERLVRIGAAYPVGERAVKYLRVHVAPRLPIAEDTITVSGRRSNQHHINNRCRAYGGGR